MNNGLSLHVYAVIMAGGIGKTLWPVSRKKMPKQFVDLFDEGTMIAKTVERISGIVLKDNIFIIKALYLYICLLIVLPRVVSESPLL